MTRCNSPRSIAIIWCLMEMSEMALKILPHRAMMMRNEGKLGDPLTWINVCFVVEVLPRDFEARLIMANIFSIWTYYTLYQVVTLSSLDEAGHRAYEKNAIYSTDEKKLCLYCLQETTSTHGLKSDSNIMLLLVYENLIPNCLICLCFNNLNRFYQCI